MERIRYHLAPRPCLCTSPYSPHTSLSESRWHTSIAKWTTERGATRPPKTTVLAVVYLGMQQDRQSAKKGGEEAIENGIGTSPAEQSAAEQGRAEQGAGYTETRRVLSL